ncbi:hypothetical protein GCM10009813_13500 [Brevibacterium marinum]
MDFGRESARVRDPPQQAAQKVGFVETQAIGVCLLVSLRQRPDLGEDLLTVCGQTDLVTASIAPAATALDQLTPFEAIEHRNDPAGPDPDLLTEYALTDSGSAADQSEQTCI